jgi:hypothetical protein
VPELIFLTPSQVHTQACGDRLDVAHIETDKLATAKSTRESKEQQRAIAGVAHSLTERMHHALELGQEHGRGAHLAIAMHTTDAALERSDARIVIRARQTMKPMKSANGFASTPNRARFSPGLRQVREVARECCRQSWQSALTAIGAPTLKQTPIAIVRPARVVGARRAQIQQRAHVQLRQVLRRRRTRGRVACDRDTRQLDAC